MGGKHLMSLAMMSEEKTKTKLLLESMICKCKIKVKFNRSTIYISVYRYII